MKKKTSKYIPTKQLLLFIKDKWLKKQILMGLEPEKENHLIEGLILILI